MSVDDPHESILLANRAYAIDLLIEEGLEEKRPQRAPLGVGDLVRFLHGKGGPLTPEQTRTLFARQDLRQTLQRLKTRTPVVDVPMLAAASDETVSRRSFGEGTLVALDSATGEHVNLTLTLTSRECVGRRCVLYLMSPRFGSVRIVFDGAVRRDGSISRILSLADPEHVRMAEAARYALSSGFIEFADDEA